uniref:Uncharacterized protein n=1 Tax=Anguilla anguilla TaxID=7936 RepID=A0A0E9WL43_ANGAN
MKHVCRPADHGEVVDDEHGLQVHRLPVLHELGPGPQDEEIAEEDDGDRHGRVDQQPRVRSLVSVLQNPFVEALDLLPSWIHQYCFLALS